MDKDSKSKSLKSKSPKSKKTKVVKNETLNEKVIEETLNEKVIEEPTNEKRIKEPKSKKVIKEPKNKKVIEPITNEKVIEKPKRIRYYHDAIILTAEEMEAYGIKENSTNLKNKPIVIRTFQWYSCFGYEMNRHMEGKYALAPYNYYWEIDNRDYGGWYKLSKTYESYSPELEKIMINFKKHIFTYSE